MDLLNFILSSANNIIISSDRNKRILFFATSILIYILLACIIAYLIYFFISKRIMKKRKFAIDYNTSSVRVYTMNLKNNTVTFFDKKNMGRIFTITVDAFFQYFKTADDANKVKSWIEDIISAKRVSNSTLTVTMRSNVDNKNSMSILKFTGYNPKTKILHFENTILPKVKTNEKRKFIKSGKKGYSYIINFDDAKELFKNKKFSKRNINCIAIKVAPFNLENGASLNSTLNNSITSIYQPLNSIYKFLNKDRQLVFINDEEAIIFDTRLVLHYDLNILCQHIMSEIEKYFSIRSLNNIYDITIGVSYFYPSGNDQLEDICNQARDLAKQASQYESKKKIIYINDEETSYENMHAIFKSDIRKVIANKAFDVSYTPILSTELDKLYFVTKFESYGTGFNSNKELLEASKKLGLLPSIYSMVFNKVNMDLGENKNTQKVVMSISYNNIDDFIKACKKKNNINENLAVGFKFSEIHDFYQADVEIEKKVETLQKLGVKTILELDTDTRTWFKDILVKFDMYIIKSSNNDSFHLSTRDNDQLIFSYNSLKNYNKPIIVDKLQSASDIELASNIGYKSVICTQFGPANSVPTVPDEFWKNSLDQENYVDVE